MVWIKRILIIAGISSIVYVLTISLFVLSPTISDFFNRTDFEKETWIAWEETESTRKVRWDMIHDLTNNYDLIGKSITQVEDLLGEPDWKTNNEFGYYLGSTGHGINTGSLYLRMEDGIVIEFNVWQG